MDDSGGRRRKTPGDKGPTRKRSPVLNTDVFFEHGKVPPQAIDMEEVVLGALMLESESPETLNLITKMKPEVFYKEQHQTIATAIKRLVEKELPTDILMVTEELRSMGELEVVGGAYYVTLLTGRVSSAKNTTFHYAIVYQKYMARELIRVGSEVVKVMYEDEDRCFEVLDQFITEMENVKYDTTVHTEHLAREVGDEFIEELENDMASKSSEILVNAVYETGHPRLDAVVSFARDRLILISGAAKHGKTKFVSDIIFRLLERYPREIAVYWVILEDSRKDILRLFLARKIFIKPKMIELRKFPKYMKDVMLKWTRIFNTWDITFRDTPITSKEAAANFKRFCKIRPDKLCILVFDNVMSAADQDTFMYDPNRMYDYIMSQMSTARQTTKQLVIVLHHFNDAQMDADNIDKAYRPRLKDIKGTEAFRRVPTQTIMINFFRKYKDLVNEYNGEKDKKELIRYLLAVDIGANRHEDDEDEMGLIHMFANLDFGIYQEVSLDSKTEENEPPIKYDPTRPVII